MSDELEIDVDLEDDEGDPEKPTETLWQRYLKQVSLDESRRYQALEFARLAYECPHDKFVELAAAIDAFLRDGRPTELPKKLRAIKSD